jgi:hypothetical protein
MKELLEILKYILPSLVVLLVVALMMRYFYKTLKGERDRELFTLERRRLLPMRLQAYERLSLFLERITVDSLVVREQREEFTCRDFHQHLLAEIRAEYEHNLTQQVYITSEAWNVVRNAKEGTIRLINTAALQVNPKGPAYELSKQILEAQMEENSSPSQVALEFLRREVRQLFE